MTQTTIDSNKIYSKNEIIQLGVLGKYEPTVRKKLIADVMGANRMKVRIEGTGIATRYFVKGKDLISYLEG